MAEAMESVSCSEPKRSYSWWWDSHITPKNSKWLQENLADMDSKIESMIKLIEEDADSFARRAEMYYKKRPELMKLVEEFYRAYRALAERYDHVTGALRQAHRTISVAFPNQIQFILPDEPPSALPDTVEEVKDNFTAPSYSNGSREPADENIPFMNKEEWKQLNCLLAEDEAQKKFAECFLSKGLNLNKSLMNQIISEPEEVCHCNDEICVSVTTFDATEEGCLDLEKESSSLQSELNNFDEIVSRQMEEDLDLSKKNQNLHNKIESESIRAELAEAESCRLRGISCTGDQFANDSNEMPIGSTILNIGEEQYNILQEENNYLQHAVDEFKNIVAGQEEEVTLKEEQLNRFMQSVEDERNRQTVAKVANEQSLKKQHSQCEEQITPLSLGILSGTEMRKLSRGELGELKKFNVEDNYLNENSFSYISEIGGLQDDINFPRGSKLEIGDETKVREDVSYYLKNKCTPEERYCELKKRIEEVNFNLVSLRALIMELHDLKREPKGFNLEYSRLMKSTSDTKYYCESVQRDSPNHESQNAAVVSHVEAEDQSIKKPWEKSRFFENSLSDIFVEFEGLRGKMKALEESCQSLVHQNCDLIAENSSLIAQLENLKQDMQSLEDRFSNFEGNYVTTEKENHVLFFRNQTSDLNNQIQTLREENEHLNEELEDEQHKTVKSGIDFCIMQNFLYDMNKKNRILSDECQMHMKKLRRAERLASKFKQDQLVQEKILALLLEYDNKLSELMHLMLMSLDSKEDCVTSEGGNKDVMHLISHKMVDLQVSVSDSNEEFQHLQIKKSPFTVLLEQLGLSLVQLRAQKNLLQRESEMLNEEISLLHGKNYELTEVNEKMRNDFTASYRQKEELNIEMEEMHKKLLAGRFISHGEIPELLAETRSLSNKLYESKEQKKATLNGESQAIHDHLSSTFSSDTEKSSTIDQVGSGVPNPNGITNDLDHEISVNNGNMTASQHGNMHSETKNVLPIELEMNIQILLKENARKDDEIGFLRQSNDKFVTESSIWHKNAEVLRRREKILTDELQRAKDESKRFEEELAACLFDIHVASINGFIYEEKIVELVLKLKNFEAFDSLYSEMPIGEGSLRNVQKKTLMEKLHVLENENKELKEELSGYLPLVASLDNDITSLEELTLSSANHHILSSKKKQDNTVLAPHQTMKFIQVRGEDHIPMVSSGITVLKKLHAMVKLLQKEVSNTERLLAREETIVDSNLLCKTTENKAERSKGSTAQLETEKKKDIVFDSRKSNASDEDVRLNRKFSNLKQEHITKDIELDHVLSITSDFHADSDEQAPKMLEAAVNYVKEDQEIEIMEKELSIDTIELPENASKSHQEWSTRIGEILSSDALRLAALQKNVEEMKNMGSVLNTVNEQLKASEAVIMQLTDINFKLARTAHNFTANLDDHEENGRWKISDRVQRASEKIGEVELELQNTQKSLLEIQEEESKEAKALQRKSRISFKSFLYGRSADSRKKKRRFCSCLGLSNKDD